MKINVVKKPKTKVIKKTKKKIKNSNQLELIFKENKNNNIKNHNKDLSFNYSNTVNSISRVFLSSFALISFFYIMPLFISFTENNFNTKEFKNNSKKILAYTLDKQNENKENTKTEFTEIWSQWWTKRDLVFCSCEHECKSYHSNFCGKLTRNFW